MGYDFHLSARRPAPDRDQHQRRRRLSPHSGAAGPSLLLRADGPHVRHAGRPQAAGSGLRRHVPVGVASPARRRARCAPSRSWMTIPARQYLAPEFELARELFLAHGIQAVITDPRQLDWRERRAMASGPRGRHAGRPGLQPADRLLSVRTRPRRPARSLRDRRHRGHASSARARAARRQAQPGRAQRRRAAGRMGRLARRPRRCSREVVPRTQLVTAENAEDLWAQRRQLFFKPATGYGSKAAYRGDKLTRRVWGEILAAPYRGPGAGAAERAAGRCRGRTHPAQARHPRLCVRRPDPVAGRTHLVRPDHQFPHRGRWLLARRRPARSDRPARNRERRGNDCESSMTVHVLILCTHNSARSVLAEGMLNHLAGVPRKDVRAPQRGQRTQRPHQSIRTGSAEQRGRRYPRLAQQELGRIQPAPGRRRWRS